MNDLSPSMSDTNETLGVEEAAALLRAEAATVMQYARRGELPGTRIGKAWVFMRADVIAFLRSQIAADTDARRRHASRAILAVAVPPLRDGRRRLPPVLPDLPAIEPVNKKSP